MRRIVPWALIALLWPAWAAAQSREEVDFVKKLFAELQPRSFDKRREYCGFIGRDAAGDLIATEPQAGNHDSCGLDWPREMDVIASYHTHGAFDFLYHNELPSDMDLLSDQALGVNGWIATPGGRIWYVDSARMVAKQVCGVGCLPVAPNFYKAQAGDVARSYTFDDLVERLSR
ncbi:DUF4329 domain-containing protein [Rubellimicrobium roseum]|uniref:DUF4329 domain-containing protein n=1 Tax=Rubellimicrobium roseum TaxID=687525 RepID=A0A5C4NB51_9RHOB|nr:DUF4329 domain-containing protein [Rubellimicrobium roseum]TNC70361.1 DUF4329 domain-containing protein [Rubellimicrobium roseum]